jgi:hypothetical protein
MVELIPIFGMLTGVAIIWAGVFGFVKIAQGPVGQAVARRIHGHDAGSDSDVQAELSDLRSQVDALRRQLEETQERMDFAERLLTRQRAPDELAGGR